jgi:hypothetical protein
MQLFDLQSDPGEQTDVADEHPEEVSRLKAAFDAINRDVSAVKDRSANGTSASVG